MFNVLVVTRDPVPDATISSSSLVGVSPSVDLLAARANQNTYYDSSRRVVQQDKGIEQSH